MTSPALVVLAAGRATRYGRLKQLEPFGPRGETLLEYTAADAAATGFDCLVVVASPSNEREMRETLAPHLGRHLRVRWATQHTDDVPPGCPPLVSRASPLGTAHAVYAARQHLTGPFAVANADDLYGRSALAALAEALRDDTPPWCLVTYAVRATLPSSGGVSRALCTVDDADARLTDIVELCDVQVDEMGTIRGQEPDGRVRQMDPEDPVSMNLWGFTMDVLQHLEAALCEFLRATPSDRDELALPDVVRDALRSGTAVRALPAGHSWLGVTHGSDRDAVVRALAARGPGPRGAR